MHQGLGSPSTVVHPDHVIPWKLKGNVHWGSGPDVVGQEEMVEDGGGVGPGTKQVRKLMFFVGLSLQ